RRTRTRESWWQGRPREGKGGTGPGNRAPPPVLHAIVAVTRPEEKEDRRVGTRQEAGQGAAPSRLETTGEAERDGPRPVALPMRGPRPHTGLAPERQALRQEGHGGHAPLRPGGHLMARLTRRDPGGAPVIERPDVEGLVPGRDYRLRHDYVPRAESVR